MKIQAKSLSALKVGQSDFIDVDVRPEDVDRFADLSGDRSPLHVDEAFARERGFAGRVAHGMLIGSFVSRLVGTQLPGPFGMMKSVELQFRRPLVPPRTIRVSGEIASISAGTGQVAIKIEVTDGPGDPLATGLVKSIVRDGKKEDAYGAE